MGHRIARWRVPGLLSQARTILPRSMVQRSASSASPALADLELVRSVLAGQRAELPRLADRLTCLARLLQLLDRRHGHALGPEELADLAQDVLVLVWRKLSEYEGLAPLEGWTYGICLFEYRNALRRKRRLAEEARVIAARSGARALEERDPDPWAFEEVHEALRRIGREEARVIRLKHFEGRTFEEIGVALGQSPNTVKARYYRGLEELRPLMEAGGGDP